MMDLTLFEVVAITGLCPDSEVFYHYSLPQKIFDVLKGALNSFGSFVMYYNKKKGSVTDEEHLAFLLLWLSAFCMCNKNVQVSRDHILFTNLLHEGRRFAFGQLLLGELF